MANTTTRAGRVITITGLDANWNLATDIPDYATTGLKIRSIKLIAGAANNHMVIREGSSAGPCIFQATAAATTDELIQYYGGGWFFPTITIDQCSGTLTNAAVMINID